MYHTSTEYVHGYHPLIGYVCLMGNEKIAYSINTLFLRKNPRKQKCHDEERVFAAKHGRYDNLGIIHQTRKPVKSYAWYTKNEYFK